jgi:tripartite-type tricarboxylate transporter receptor subunit TctC
VVEYARANPGKLSVGNWGNGSITHVAAVEFADKAGIKLLHVPYKGAAPALAEVINGSVDLTFFPLAGPLLGQIKANNVKPIAIAADQRNAYLPDVPAFGESKSAKGVNYTIWSGIFAAPGTPDSIVTRLNAVLGSHMASDTWRAEQTMVGATLLTPKSVKQTEDFYKAEVQKIQNVIKNLPLDAKP